MAANVWGALHIKTQHNFPFLKSWLDVMTALMADRMWQKWHRKKRLTELIHDH